MTDLKMAYFVNSDLTVTVNFLSQSSKQIFERFTMLKKDKRVD